MKDARYKLIDLENCTDQEIDQIERQFKALSAERNVTRPTAIRAYQQSSHRDCHFILLMAMACMHR